MLRVILDTNILFSAIGWQSSILHEIIRAGTAGKYQLVLNPFIIDEAKRKIRQKIKDPIKLEELIVYLKATNYELVPDPIPEEIIQNLHLIPNDPKDVPIALTAIQAGVDVLVTGNTKDFFDRASDELHQAVKVMTPRQFYDTYLSE